MESPATTARDTDSDRRGLGASGGGGTLIHPSIHPGCNYKTNRKDVMMMIIMVAQDTRHKRGRSRRRSISGRKEKKETKLFCFHYNRSHPPLLFWVLSMLVVTVFVGYTGGGHPHCACTGCSTLMTTNII